MQRPGKYAPLAERLRASSPPVRMTFDEAAELVGGLPPSAYRWPAWWANSRSHVQAVSWLDEGWRVDEADLGWQVVVFALPGSTVDGTAEIGVS